MIGNPTPQTLRLLLRTTLLGFPELLESGALTAAERQVYNTLARQRLEAGRLDLACAALLAAGVGSKIPAAA